MKYIVTVNDKNYEVEVEKGVAQVLNIQAAALQTVAPQVVATPVQTAQVSSQSTVAGEITAAPMPGVIMTIKKAVGDTVKIGDIVLTLEAMKMENEITATKGGTIAQILTAKGVIVDTGDPLFVVS